MKAIKKEPGMPAEIIDIENTLPALQEAIGGYIEAFAVTPDVLIICDEESKLKHREYNFTFMLEQFVGTVLVVGADGEDFTDLSEPELVKRLMFAV